MARMEMASKSMKEAKGGSGMPGSLSLDGGSKYARYTDEQVAILERVYGDCPKPSSAKRQQIIREFPTLSNIGQKQIKVWFQNRRCREKQRKETGRLLTWNSKLNAMNQILLEENERLYKQATQLNTENQVLRQQLQLQLPTTDLNQRGASHQVIMASTDTSSESVVTSGMQRQHSPQQQSQDASQSQLFTIAEKTLREFLVKATGNETDWIQIPGMKPGPDSVGVGVASNTRGAAARSCGFVDIEPIKPVGIFHYVKGSLDYGVSYEAKFDAFVFGYSDAEWTGTIVDISFPLVVGWSHGDVKSNFLWLYLLRRQNIEGLQMQPVVEIVKNRPLWLQDCRRMEVLGTFNVENGGLLELVHMQMYAPTTLASARDFCTLRYTCCLKDGSLVVCERSLGDAQMGNLRSSASSGFIRGEMLPSGFLVRSCESGGSLIVVVDHQDYSGGGSLLFVVDYWDNLFCEGGGSLIFALDHQDYLGYHLYHTCDTSIKQAGGMPDVLHPLYESSMVLAQRMTLQVLHHLRNIAKELAGTCAIGNYPVTSLQKLSHHLVRGFNDAVNCFQDDGWISLSLEGPSPVSVHLNRPLTPPSSLFSPPAATGEAVLCAKASVLLQGISPAMLVAYLRDHRRVWEKIEAEAFEVTISRINAFPTSFSPSDLNCSSEQVLGPSFGQDELLEIIKVNQPSPWKNDGIQLSQTRILQLCTGIDESSVGCSSQLIFATLDTSVADDAPMLPSGFRMLLLDDDSDMSGLSESLNPASLLKDNLGDSLQHKRQGSSRLMLSVLTMAFQFAFEVQKCDTLALKARQYVQVLLEFVQHAVTLLCPQPGHHVDGTCSAEVMQLIRKTVESYRIHLGTELVQSRGASDSTIAKAFWDLKDAIICCAWKPLPELVFGNVAALEMLETSLPTLSSFSLERMFDEHGREFDYSKPPAFLKMEGYARLPPGLCFTTKGHPVSFDYAIGWMVAAINNTTCIAAFMFHNWSILQS